MRRHSNEEIEQAARRFEQLADDLDPGSAAVEQTADLRGIATALGVSEQAARQRFADQQYA